MKTKTIAILLSVCMLLALLAACGKANPTKTDDKTSEQDEPNADVIAETADEGITFVDMAGREIHLDAPAQSVVALTAADCEIIYALGGGDALIGRGEYCNYPAEVLDVASVESGYETNIEQIIALQPQVLLMSIMAQPKEQIEQLENAGIHVVMSDAQDINGVYEAITMIGKLLGKDAQAEELINQMKNDFEAIKDAVGAEEKTVYFEVSPLEWGLWTAGTNTFMDEVATMIGAKNCFYDVTGWGEISEEQVLERNPDYIVTIAMYYGEGPTPVEEILSRPGWENVTAVKNGAVLNLQNDELSRPGPRLADGAKMLCDFITAE